VWWEPGDLDQPEGRGQVDEAVHGAAVIVSMKAATGEDAADQPKRLVLLGLLREFSVEHNPERVHPLKQFQVHLPGILTDPTGMSAIGIASPTGECLRTSPSVGPASP